MLELNIGCDEGCFCRLMLEHYKGGSSTEPTDGNINLGSSRSNEACSLRCCRMRSWRDVIVMKIR